VQSIRDATPEQIAAVPGFSLKSAQKVLDGLRRTDALAPGVPAPDGEHAIASPHPAVDLLTHDAPSA
jgi:hypothetical protein